MALCTRAADFAPAVLEATGQHGADLVVNTVGGTVFAEDIRALAFEGRLATVGYVDGVLHADLDLGALHAKRLTLFGVSNKLRSKEQRAAAIPRFVAEVMPHFAAGRIKPQIDRVIDFARLPEAQGAHGSRRPCRQDRPAHARRILTRRPDKEDTPMKSMKLDPRARPGRLRRQRLGAARRVPEQVDHAWWSASRPAARPTSWRAR